MDIGMTPTARPRILFVDDETKVLDGLRRALHRQEAAWEMTFEESASEAIAAQARRPFDVVVADMRMPVMSGLELIKELTRLSPATVAIILTGTADLDTAIAAINEASVFRFYTKPCTAENLAEGITQALAHAAAKLPEPASVQAALGVATLNRLPMGVVAVDRSARVLFMNSSGAQCLDEEDGLTVGPTGICRASRPAATAELHKLIEGAVDGGESCPPRAVSLNRSGSDRPLSVVVAPLVSWPGAEAVAVLLVSDPERQPLPSVETVGRLFELTDAEARLALALTEGRRIEEAAEALGLTISSARTYLKRIFGKTGVTRQAELVRLVLAAPTLLDLNRGKGSS
jgi:DNA-binding NarL/FixJ family response regulator